MAAAWLTDRPLVLASASPRRLELLRQVGLEPRVLAAAVEEYQADGSRSPAQLVTDNARLKAVAAARLLAEEADGLSPAPLILAADTVVVLDNAVLGKPRDAAEARAMLTELSGREHQVYSGCQLLDSGSGQGFSGCGVTTVRFSALHPAEIAAYVASGEPLDKAGAYGIQGRGGVFVREIVGDYSTVVGLSLPLLRQLLAQAQAAEGERL